MSTNYAQIEDRTAFLSTDFGEEIARKWFGDETVDALPRYTRGARKGKLKGVVVWSKVVRGGWVRGDRETASGDATGYVENCVGRIFNRKLCEIASSRFGTEIGRVIRDLDAEEAKSEYDRVVRVANDARARDVELARCALEQLIVNDIAIEHNAVFQKMIIKANREIAALTNK